MNEAVAHVSGFIVGLFAVIDENHKGFPRQPIKLWNRMDVNARGQKMAPGRFRIKVAFVDVERVKARVVERKLAAADVVKSTIYIVHAALKIVIAFMPAR